MRNFLVFDGHDSRDYGVYISGSGVFNSPERAYTAVTVPGRSGDLLIDEDRFENAEMTYPAFIYANFSENLAALKNALLSTKGYARLTDSYHPGEFRLAYFPGGVEVEPTQPLDAGQFELTFICKPQRFLTSGEIPITFTSGGSITNPTRFASRPLIRVYGDSSGYLYVGSDRIFVDLEEVADYVDLDSDIQDAYWVDEYGITENLNNFVTLQNNSFPVLAPGTTGISFDGTIERVEITPRWYIV